MLSRELREELNERIEEGQQGKELVKWLNSTPEVQNTIRFGFRGKPISEQNLSQWKNGGYREWQEKEERRFMVHQLREEAEEMRFAADPEETQRHLSVMLTLELARAVQEIKENTPDLKERLERLEPLIGKFVQLRREESNARRVEMQWKLHRSELGAGGGGFGLEGALQQLESEAESRAPAAVGTANDEKKSLVSAGAKKRSGKKRVASKGKLRQETLAGSVFAKLRRDKRRRSQEAAGSGQAEVGDVVQEASSQAAGDGAELGQPDPSESKPIKVDQSAGEAPSVQAPSLQRSSNNQEPAGAVEGFGSHPAISKESNGLGGHLLNDGKTAAGEGCGGSNLTRSNQIQPGENEREEELR